MREGIDRINLIMTHALKFPEKIHIIADAEQSYL